MIKGNQLQEGTLLLTSRHWASQPFLLPHSTNRRVSQHIEILGFTEEDIGKYLRCTLKNSPGLLHDMEQYLQLHPHIHSMMYIPLNCAIVLEVYRHSKKQNSLIPRTMTELFSSLIRSLLLRHICELPEYRDTIVALEDLRNLPVCIKYHFRRLCRLAFWGIFQKTQQIIFSADDLPSGLNTLGLMQSSMELYVDVGAKKSFNFLHLTIQEFLAACHIALFPIKDQEWFFACYEDDDNTMVVRFLAGLSPPALKNGLVDTGSSSVLKLRIEDIHRLFEAKLQPPQRDVLNDPNEPIVNQFSSYILGYLIANSSCQWDVFIGGKREIRTIQMFTHGILDKKDGHFESKLTLHVKIEDYIHSDVAELLNVPIAIKQLELRPYFENKTFSEDMLLHPAIDADNNSGIGIKHLCLSKLKFNCDEAEKLRLYLSNATSITSLSLVYCKFKSKSNINALDHVLEGVNACKSIQKLNLFFSPHFEHQYGSIFGMLERSKSLTELRVTSDLYGVCMLADALCANCTLKVLVIEGDSVDYELEKNNVSIAVAKLLKENKALLDFNLANVALTTEDICIIAEVMCCNSNLERLHISHGMIQVKGSETLAKMLEENRTLKHLNLSSCCIVNNGACIIAEALIGNCSLEMLSISVDSIGKSAQAFASVLKENTTLKELHISDIFSFLRKTTDEWITEFVILSNALHQNTTLKKLNVTPPLLFQAEAMIQDVLADEYVKDNRISS